jgi:hypothetical protein
MTSRWRMDFTSFDILRITFTKAVAPLKRALCSKWSDDPHSTHARKLHLYDQGKSKVMKELDCVSFLGRMRKLELLIETILTSKQRFLMSMQKKGHFLRYNTDNRASKSLKDNKRSASTNRDD